MNHPYEQLADLVDGTLDDDDLAGVQAHLDTCASCRGDFAHATAGREAARSLPQATAPADLHRRVTVAAGGRGAPTWYRWAGVAAAAAVVVAIAIALPNVGGRKNQNTAEDARVVAGQAAENAGSGVQPEVEDKNYDAKDLERLASAVASDTATAETAPQFAQADSPAAGCVSKAFEGQPLGQLARLIQARFEGRPAYIAVYLEGPGAGEPADTVVVWAAAKDDCTILSFASARI
jgi:anti-sigma factor RsiW